MSVDGRGREVDKTNDCDGDSTSSNFGSFDSWLAGGHQQISMSLHPHAVRDRGFTIREGVPDSLSSSGSS